MPIDLKNKKILVTGAGGFLGQHIVEKLKSRGVSGKNIRAPRSKEIDLRKKENCEKAVEGVDLVVHAAGVTGGVQFHKEHPAEIFYDNLMMGVELMEAARIKNIEKFIAIGSATEYPDNAPLPYREEDIWLGPPEESHAPYTTAKRMLLVEGQAYRKQYGMNVIHLLPTNMYGPRELDSFVIPALIKKIGEAKKNGAESIELWGTGKPTRDFLYVEDAAEGIILALEKYDKPEPANLGSGWEISIRELAEIVSRLMGFNGSVRWDSSKPDGQMRRMLDTSRADREFGFRAATDFETGLKKTIEYHTGK